MRLNLANKSFNSGWPTGGHGLVHAVAGSMRTRLTTNGKHLIAPKLNRRRAVFVILKIDEIQSREEGTERERDSKLVELGRQLCEVRAGQYWRVDNVRSFDEFLERKFPESRSMACYLMAIHEQLPRIHKVELQQVGWPKATEPAKAARKDGQRFESATQEHKARELPKEEFKQEVSKHLTGKETEPWEILYFKEYKSYLPVIEQALETETLILGSGKSRGYCLEMICADFLAGVSVETNNQNALLPYLTRLVIAFPKPQRNQLIEKNASHALKETDRCDHPCGLRPKRIANSAGKFWSEMVGDANHVGAWKIFKFITFSGGAGRAMISTPIWLLIVLDVTKECTEAKSDAV